MALNGREVECMHLQVEWRNARDSQSKALDFSWEPVNHLMRDVPGLVRSYFERKNIDVR